MEFKYDCEDKYAPFGIYSGGRLLWYHITNSKVEELPLSPSAHKEFPTCTSLYVLLKSPKAYEELLKHAHP